MIYFVYGCGYTLGFNPYLINILYFCCSVNMILWATCALMLCTKLIYVGLFCCIWMPGIIKTIVIYVIWNNPILIFNCFNSSGCSNILYFLSTWNTINRATSFLPLCAKLIDKRLFSCVRSPRKIKTVDIYSCRNCPVFICG